MDKHTEEMMKRAQESFDKMMEKSTPAQRQDAAFKAMYGAAMLHEPTMVKADRKHLDQLSGPVFSDFQSMKAAETEDEIARLRAELKRQRKVRFQYSKLCKAEQLEVKRLRAELEAARVDAERYQWIKGNVRKQYSVWWINGISARTGPTDFEVAIDAARGKDNE